VANLILCEPSLSDAGALYGTGSNPAATPWTNLQLMQPKEVWETDGVTTAKTQLSIDLGASASYDTFALLFTNASAAATWTISNSTAPSSGFTDLVTSATFRAAGQTGYTRTHALYKHASTQTRQFVKLAISDTGNAEGVFRAGRLYVCKAYSPTVNASYGLALGFDDLALGQVVTSAGERITRRNDPIPILSFTLAANGSAAWAEVQDNLFELMRKRSASRDVMAVVDPADASYLGRLIHYGTLQQRLAIALPAYQFFQSSFELTGLV